MGLLGCLPVRKVEPGARVEAVIRLLEGLVMAVVWVEEAGTADGGVANSPGCRLHDVAIVVVWEAKGREAGERVGRSVGRVRAARADNRGSMWYGVLLEMEGGIGLVGIDGPITQLL